MSKEILAQLGVLGVSVPKCIAIPVLATFPETDLLNIQMTVMDMLVDDPEISKLVSNCWSLGVDIKAFNVQRQCWDLLDLQDDLELPNRASIQVIITDNEQEDPEAPSDQKAVRKRDPRRKVPSETEDSRQPQSSLSRRDPRRKLKTVDEVELDTEDTEDELPRALLTDPDPSKLSRNDPRRKKLLQKTQSGDSSSPAQVQPSNSLSPVGSVQPSTSSRENEDSDSDEGNLQIDEGFDDKISRKSPINRNMITESQLSVGDDENSPCDIDVGDKDMWDEIYGVSESPEAPYKIFDPNLSKKAATRNPGESDIILEKDLNLVNISEKSLEQLTREKELLESLMAERDKMNEMIAKDITTPEEITIDNEIEEGELSDSSIESEVVATKDKDSDIEIVTPTSPVDPGTSDSDRKETDFVSPASPTAIQLDFGNDEIDIIPLEREDSHDSVKDQPEVVEIVPTKAPSLKNKKDEHRKQFTEKVEELKEDPSSDQFSAAREKLSKYTKFGQGKRREKRDRERESRKAFEAPKALFQKAAVELLPGQTQSPRDPGYPLPLLPPLPVPPVPPKELFWKAAQRSGISPFTNHNRSDQGVLGHSGPSHHPFTPGSGTDRPGQSGMQMRKGIALLNTPNFPPPVKVTDSARLSDSSTGSVYSSKAPPPASQSSSYPFPPPPPPIFQKHPASFSSNSMIIESNPVKGHKRPDSSNVWMSGWSRKESNTSDSRRQGQGEMDRFNRRDGRRKRRSGDRGLRRSRSRSPKDDGGSYRNSTGGNRSSDSRERQRRPESSVVPHRLEDNSMKLSEKALLCFYEGEDCIEDEPVHLPPPVTVRQPNTAAPSNLAVSKHPVTAIYEYIRRMGYPPARFKERWGPGGGWAFDVSVGPHTFSCPLFQTKKKDAKAEACKYALKMLGTQN